MKKLLFLLLIASCFLAACTSTISDSNDSSKDVKKLNPPKVVPSDLIIDDQTDIMIIFDEGAECYYTTDGKAPNSEDGKKYTGPFRLSKSGVIRVGVFKDGYENAFATKYYQVVPKSTEDTAFLDSLSIGGIDDLVFNKLTTNYEFNVSNSMDKAVFYPSAEFGEITVDGKKCQNGENVSVTLEIGENIIEVCVENAGLTKTYKIKIVRQSENPSDNATLRSLELKHGNDLIALTPVFSPNVVNYTANVDYDVSSVALSYETADSAAVASIDIENLKDIPLNIGKNAINIIVTAEDGTTTKTYCVNIARADKPVNDCKLASVSVNGKNLAVKSEMEVTVDTSSVAISVTSENSAHTVTIAGEEASDVVLDLTGENLLEIKVDSGNGAFITYKLKIKVLQISAATLAGIKVDDKTLTVQKNMGHVVAAKNAVVTVEVNNETQSVKINNEDITSSKNYSVKVAADDATFGNKSVKITLTDKEGKTVDYYLTLTYQETVTGKIIVHAYNYTHIWAWNKADEKDNYTGGKWPGVEMTQEENSNWYTFTIEKTTSMVIFSNKGAGQTANLERTEG
ncbi:MAG: cadherin-like beta sandwich domain-containing protein, partial [Spirochaetales bacterium]|nr:cadherin-like beta sandwich domain-containing protein [Spirochaetales bacterium]